MKRVTSRQRLVSWDAFDANAYTSDDEEFLLGPSSMNRIHSTNIHHDQLDLGICRKRCREFGSSKSSFFHASPAMLVPAFKYEVKDTTIDDLKLEFRDVNDDVKLHIMSFLEPPEARAVAATCHKLRSLLLSREAQYLWTEWCHYQWPMLNGKSMVFRDDFCLPTALGNLNNSLEANLSLLLGMASKNQPTRIDESKFVPARLQPRIHNWGMPQQPERQARAQFRSFTQNDVSVVQFVGGMGNGERCFRADQPLPRPKRVKSHRKWSLPHSQKGSKHSLRHVFCRASRSSKEFCWRPFVAPYMNPPPPSSASTDSAPLEVHLTPRLVSYFEVSVLKRNESQEPPLSDPIPQRTSATECVAVGVSCSGFRLQSRMPGWDSLSYGYHGDDGGIFHASGEILKQFGPRYGPGDTVGCGVDYVCGGIFFTLNGKFLGYGWTGIDMEFLEHCNLYPTVGVDTNCPIACNFGDRPFQYDLTPLVKYHGGIVEGCLAPKAISAFFSIRRPKIFAVPLKIK